MGAAAFGFDGATAERPIIGREAAAQRCQLCLLLVAPAVDDRIHFQLGPPSVARKVPIIVDEVGLEGRSAFGLGARRVARARGLGRR